MNYFLGYDNSHPMLIGGQNHGRKMRVQAEWYHLVVPLKRDLTCRLNEMPIRFDDPQFITMMRTERYRQEWFLAEGRKFRLFIHEQLPTHGALMLLLSLAGEQPDMAKRIQHLEEENRVLKKMLGIVVGG